MMIDEFRYARGGRCSGGAHGGNPSGIRRMRASSHLPGGQWARPGGRSGRDALKVSCGSIPKEDE